MGIVKSFFGISYYIKNNEDYFVFDVTSYVPLSTYKEISPYDFMSILELLFSNIEIAKDYLFEPTSYVITKDTVYLKCDEKGKILDLKLIYIPFDGKISEKNIYLNFIHSINDKLDEEGEVYEKDMYEYIKRKSYSYTSILRHIIDLKKEIKTFEKY